MAVGLRRLTWASRAVTRTMRSSCAWTTNGEVHGESLMHNNVNRCLHKLILISVAIEAAMLENSMTSHENALYSLTLRLQGFQLDIQCTFKSCLHIITQALRIIQLQHTEWSKKHHLYISVKSCPLIQICIKSTRTCVLHDHSLQDYSWISQLP